jgi:hypothetical protein
MVALGAALMRRSDFESTRAPFGAGPGRSRRAALFIVVTGLVAAVFVGAGQLGADVGGVITVGAGFAVATVLMLPGRLTWRRVLIVLAVPAVALCLLAGLDIVTGGNSHFTRSILDAGSAGSVEETIGRRYELAFQTLKRGLMPVLTGLALLAVAYGLRWRRDLYAPVADHAGWRAALGGSLVACVVGALVNDSGPVLLVFGVILLALATAYVQGAAGSHR